VKRKVLFIPTKVIVAQCCAMLRDAARCCAMLRDAARCCAMLRDAVLIDPNFGLAASCDKNLVLV
jgi:hypothetical protein